MRLRRLLAVVAVFVVTSSLPGVRGAEAADASESLRPGARVRYRLASSSVFMTGSVVERDDEWLLVEIRKGVAPVRLNLGLLEQLDVSRGRRSRTGAGALVGAGIGLTCAGAAVVAWGPGLIDSEDPRNARGMQTTVAACLGGGIVLGALVGHGLTTDRWERIDDRRVQLSVGPVPGRGVAGAITLSF